MTETYESLKAEAAHFRKLADEKEAAALALFLESEPDVFKRAVEARKSLPEEMPTIDWFRWAKEMGFEWADSAIEQWGDNAFFRDCLSEAINSAFYWDESKEGYGFWPEIVESLSDHGL